VDSRGSRRLEGGDGQRGCLRGFGRIWVKRGQKGRFGSKGSNLRSEEKRTGCAPPIHPGNSS